MNHLKTPAAPAILFLVLGLLQAAPAAEIEFHSLATPRGPLVRLGDIATIRGGDAQTAAQLSQLELVLAPTAGEQRYLRAREIQDLLAARGVRLSQHRFLGAREVLLTSGAGPADPEQQTQAAPTTADQWERLAAAAIERYLNAQSDGGRMWRAKPSLTRQQLAQIATMTGSLRVERPGSTEPTPAAGGRGQFDLFLKDASGREFDVPVEAELMELLPQVVAVRNLSRGALIRAEDVRLEYAESSGGRRYNVPISAIADVVGQETRQPISAGQALGVGDIRRPILVRRGEEETRRHLWEIKELALRTG